MLFPYFPHIVRSLASDVFELRKFDKGFDKDVSCFKSGGKFVVYSPLDIDNYSDVREYFKAAKKGVERALKGEFKNPVIILPSTPKFSHGELSSLLGALAALYVPIQFREAASGNAQRINNLFISSMSPISKLKQTLENGIALESALFISR